MVKEITGDLTQIDVSVICHQDNFHGVMGGGVALSIWNKLLDDPARQAYVNLCVQEGRNLLGKVQYLAYVRPSDGFNGLVFNLFCQDDRPQSDGSLTRYDYMRVCLMEVERAARLNKLPAIAVPGHMGCGIAGGDWNTVYGIIQDVFAESPVDCIIVHWDGQRGTP